MAFLVKGGPVMIPILLCGALTLAIIIEKLRAFHIAEIDAESFLVRIEEVLKKREIRKALEICDETSKPVPNIIKAGLLKSDRNREEIKEAISDAAAHEVPQLERYLGILATIATIAPLLGFFGTVTGLIKAFMVIEQMHGFASPEKIAGGVWESLITTGAGIGVAIPAYLAYNYFVSRVQNIVLQMEKSSSRLLDIFFLLKPDEEA
ncbi:MAG: MotA/TolQ/ExbB proton channel family protein [Syntrophales bacterium]|jgi:biopolymer transport protein ExbB